MTLFLNPAKALAASPIVWLEDGMTKINKTDPAKSANTITLYTAKNEFEPFQIVVKAPPANTLSTVNITVSDLTGPNGSLIASDNIILYREHYLNVTTGSKHHTGETNAPLGPGLYPDALIPFRHPETKQPLNGILKGNFFNINVNENQPVWADIYTPENTPPGLYTGTVTISSPEGIAEVTVNLNVWNFTLPKTRSFKGFTQTWNTGYQTRATSIALLKHRINPKSVARTDERFLMDNYGLDMIDVFRASGATRFTCNASPAPSITEVQAEAAKHEPGLYLLNAYGNEVFACAATAPIFLQWATNLRAGGIHPMLGSYPLNEFMGPDLDHTVADVWAFLPKHYDAGKTNLQKLITNPKIQIWPYNPLVQEGYSPKFTMDFSPINSRITQGFIDQSLGFHGSKFWRVDNWTADPWNDPNVLSDGGNPAPGEGIYAYPGTDVGLPGEIIPGARLKWYREGSEDYEYVTILKNLGQTDFALNTVRTVATDFRVWSQDKNVLYSARKTLGDKISSLGGGPTVQPTGPTPPTGGKPGDANGDNKVDGVDYVIWLMNYNKQATGASKGDFDNNGFVDGLDYTIWLQNYNK